MTAGGDLSIENVTVRYGDAVALGDFSADVGPGEVLAVVGPSGSGKSTLLRAVAGLEPLATGRVRYDGADLDGVPTHRRGLGLMFQDNALFGHLSVADNVAYGLRMRGEDVAARRRRVGELLELVGLAGFGERRPDELSGGEGQRVALARALAPEPRLLMLDEPLGSLDRSLRTQLTEDLRRLLTELEQTAIHVTHDQAEAFAVADRVAVMADGRLAALGPPAELWSSPGDEFVARFLGHPNIWDVTRTGDEVSLAGHGLGPRPATGDLSRASVGTHRVVVPIGAISIATVPGGDRTRPLAATVDDVRFDEGRYRFTAVIDEDPTAGGSGPVPTIVAYSDLELAMGEVIPLAVDLGAACLLG